MRPFLIGKAFFTNDRAKMEGTEEKQATQSSIGDRLLNVRPMFLLTVYLMLGIVFGYLLSVEGYAAWWLLGILLLPLVLVFFSKHKLSSALMAALLCAVFAFGLFSLSFRLVAFQYTTAYQGTCTVTGRVVEKSKTDNGHTIVLDGICVDGVAENGKLVAYLVAPYSDSVRLCDSVELKLSVSTNTSLTGNYGFRAEDIADDVRFVGSNAESVRVIGWSFRLGQWLRERMTNTLFASMDAQTAAVSAAMLFGDTSSIESGLLENVRYGGIAHIFAVSGLHVGAVFMACSLLFRGNRLPKLVRFLLVAVVLLFYGDLCGFSASVIRATVTCLTLYACRLLGWKYDGLESLSVAAFFVFALFPTLLFGVGAQLSFAACAGIVLLKRNLGDGLQHLVAWIERFVKQKILRKSVTESAVDVFAGDVPPPTLFEQVKRSVCSYVALSLSAQLFTLPILCRAFGYLSPISVLLNLLFVPIVTSIFCIFLLLVLVAAFFSSGISAVILYLPNAVWSVLLLLFEWLDFTSLSVTGLVWRTSGVAAWCCMLLSVSDQLNLEKRQRIFMFCLFAVSFVVSIYAMNA